MVRLAVEALGWVLMGIGAYYILQKDPSVYHYLMGIVGVILIILFFPFQDYFKRNDRDKS